MRFVCKNVLSGGDSLNQTGAQIDANQLISASFFIYFGDNQAAGTFKLQISNDPCPYGNTASAFTASHWVDLPSQSVTLTSGASKLLTVSNMTYRWIRAVYTSTATGVQIITAIAAASLNNKYFFLNSEGNATKYYVWFNVDGGGVDPAPAGLTPIEVDVLSTDNATAVGAAMATAIAAANTSADFTASNTSGAVTVTNKVAGPFTPASDFNSGFSFQVTGGGSSTVNVNMNALSI